MALQSQVGVYYSGAVAGDRASHNPVVYRPKNPLAQGVVTVGNFVFQGTDPANQVSASGSVVAGFVERIINYYNYTITSAGTLSIPDKTPVTVALKGDFYVAYNQSATPTLGQKAFASTTDGSIVFANAGATVSGHVETGFAVREVRSADSLVMISNYSPALA
ncbi:hypothetical protein CIW60_12775 [Enterobacter roggenkampii]|uniref:structural cement protein Gp24 n=1 Tax=Enterobacter roggenkampii TaxID=1812935 RepID=UPI000BA864CA|nr:hypothetical protein [Enterobacter roggenkampii]PAO09834.1 hypothetical protein CIW60_12775 [Enterobacter roggenkampii]